MGSQLQLLRLPQSLHLSQGPGPRVAYAAAIAAVALASGVSVILYPRA